MIFSIRLDRTYAFERMGRCLDVHDFSPYCITYLHGSEILYLNAWDIVSGGKETVFANIVV
jgi:hypothetical protein